MSPKRMRRCALYVRISVATDESVSIARQIEAGEAYASAQGWTVVNVFRDEGVSATKNKPEDRDGWQALMASDERFDTVIVWKVDRLARRITDFWRAYQALDETGRTLASIQDGLDMSTAMGRIIAGVLAGFAEMEAEAISARVTDARNHLLNAGRYAGGAVLYGYRAVENPEGPGYVLAHDPDQIAHVRTMVERTLAGHTIYSTMQHLNEVGAPTKTGVPEWSYNTVDRILRHPLLAGMTLHNPGNQEKRRGDNVVRGDDGLPVVDEALAVMTVPQWRSMQASLDAPNAHRQPVALRRKHSGLLSGLLVCGDPRHDEPVRMWRGTVGSETGPRPAYTCPDCHQTISNVEDLIIGHFLEQYGQVTHMTAIREVVEGGAIQYQEATVRLAELGREVVNATPERAAQIVTEIAGLKELQEEAQGLPAQVRYVAVAEPQSYASDWAEATTDEARRRLLGDGIRQIVVRRGGQGAWTDAAKLARCTFEWKPAGWSTPAA